MPTAPAPAIDSTVPDLLPAAPRSCLKGGPLDPRLHPSGPAEIDVERGLVQPDPLMLAPPAPAKGRAGQPKAAADDDDAALPPPPGTRGAVPNVWWARVRGLTARATHAKARGEGFTRPFEPLYKTEEEQLRARNRKAQTGPCAVIMISIFVVGIVWGIIAYVYWIRGRTDQSFLEWLHIKAPPGGWKEE